MSEKSITSLWECECSSKNPFRFRKCKICGRNMPEYYANKIYYEVLKEQKAFVFIENQEESKKRCLKIGSFLERAKSIVVPIMIVTVIALNAGRIYLDGFNISYYASESLADRKERLWSELDNTKEAVNGLKSTPVVIETIISDIVIKTMDVSKDLSVKQKESEKNVNYNKIEKVKNKIEKVKNKIEGVTEYVTSKFK